MIRIEVCFSMVFFEKVCSFDLGEGVFRWDVFKIRSK